MRPTINVPSHSLALVATALTHLAGTAADAAFTEYKQNQAEWESAVGGQFATLDFVFPQQVVVTNQYLTLGALFTDGNDITAYIPSAFPNDGWGLAGGLSLMGSGKITVEFTQPMHWIAMDHPGPLYIELFSGGEMIYASTWSGFPPASNYFIGIVSDQAFDKARIVNPFSTTVFIDNLYFGAPIPAPGVLGLLPALAALQPRRRRGK